MKITPLQTPLFSSIIPLPSSRRFPVSGENMGVLRISVKSENGSSEAFDASIKGSVLRL
jgi:hypothetical protein